MSIKHTNAEIALLESRLEIMKAHKNGAKIEFSAKPAVWADCPDPRWLWQYYNYRVKQEPIVRWGILDAKDHFIGTYADEVYARHTVERYYPGGRVIKLVEENV